MSQPHSGGLSSQERRLTRADHLLWAKERVITAARVLLIAMQEGTDFQVYRLALRERIREHDSALVACQKRGG